MVTLTLPDAPAPTTAVILVAELTINDCAATPPKVTAMALLKLVPEIVTVIPVDAVVGVNEVIAGVAINVKPVLVAVPPGVVTLILPEAPVPTTAVTVVVFTTENEVAAVPPKLAAVVPVKFVPVIVIIVPAAPDIGVNDVILGAGININPVNDTVPPGVVIDTAPLAPVNIMAVIVVAFTTINEAAAIPPKLTTVAPVKFVPVIVTVVPAPPLAGVKEAIVGAGIKVNPVSVPVPPGVVTLTEPDAPLLTTAVIVVALTTVNDVATVPPKLTTDAPVKFVPVIVIVVPAPPLVGVNDVIMGAGIKVNPALVNVSLGVVTLTDPVAPVPTIAVIVVELTTVNDAATTPPNLTAVAPVKLFPVMVTVAPAAADVGANDVIPPVTEKASAPISTGVNKLLVSL